MRKIIFLFFIVILFFSCVNENNDYTNFHDDYCTEKYSVENSHEDILLCTTWKFSEFSKIRSGRAILYKAAKYRRNITVAINAGHGTKGGETIKTYSHPDKSPKVTGGTNPIGAIESLAVSKGMTFFCGLSEAEINLRVAMILRKMLLEDGYDVLMLRCSDDVQLDNIARTVISNNTAQIHIAIHFDGDGLKYDKGCFYCGVPEELKYLVNVKKHCDDSEKLGNCVINGLRSQGLTMYNTGRLSIDLTQTSYSTIPTIDIELGNQCTIPDTENLEKRATGILHGINNYFK